jgi:hypothetical protein
MAWNDDDDEAAQEGKREPLDLEGKGFWEGLAVLGGRLADAHGQEQSAFYVRHRQSTSEEKRLELKKLQREVQRRKQKSSSDLDAAAGAAAQFLKSLRAAIDHNSEALDYTVVPEEELLRRIDFLEERLKSPEKAPEDHQLEAARENRRRDRRYDAAEAFGPADELAEARQEKVRRLKENEQKLESGEITEERHLRTLRVRHVKLG